MTFNNVRFTPVTDAEGRPAKIVSDPGMAIVRDTDSKVIPIVQIDAMDRPDIVSLISAHGPGVVGEAATHGVDGLARRKAPSRYFLITSVHGKS